MSIVSDYHLHTRLCKHAEGEVGDYVRAAAEKGLIEIGFADHFPWPVNYDVDSRMFPEEWPRYRDWILEAKNNPYGVRVLFGAEVDWVPGRMDEVFAVLDRETFDYLLLSAHYVDDFPFDNDKFLPVWKKAGQADYVWERYADLLSDAVDCGRFQALAHFDLPKKFGYYPSAMGPFREKATRVMEKMAAKNMTLEINASGLRKPVGEIYPSLDLLKTAREKGVAITFGSDSHRSDEVAAGFAEAEALARAAGYREYRHFGPEKKTSPL